MTPPFIKQFGSLALASRLRSLIEHMAEDIEAIYAYEALSFHPRWYMMVALLHQSPSLPIGQIAQALGITHAGVNQLAKELTEAGLITSACCEKDKRKRRLALTPLGETRLLELQPIVEQVAQASQALCQATGFDVLAVLDQLESVLAQAGFMDRYLQHKNHLAQQPSVIKPWHDLSPEQQALFKPLQDYWLGPVLADHSQGEAFLQTPQETILNKHGQLWLALTENEQEAIGTLTLVHQSSTVAELGGWFVKPGYRHQGIGKQLLNTAMDYARQHPYDTLRCNLPEDSPIALSVCRALGFMPVTDTTPSLPPSFFDCFTNPLVLSLNAPTSPLVLPRSVLSTATR